MISSVTMSNVSISAMERLPASEKTTSRKTYRTRGRTLDVDVCRPQSRGIGLEDEPELPAAFALLDLELEQDSVRLESRRARLRNDLLELHAGERLVVERDTNLSGPRHFGRELEKIDLLRVAISDPLVLDRAPSTRDRMMAQGSSAKRTGQAEREYQKRDHARDALDPPEAPLGLHVLFDLEITVSCDDFVSFLITHPRPRARRSYTHPATD